MPEAALKTSVLMLAETPWRPQSFLRESAEPEVEAVVDLKGKRAVVVEDEGVTQLQLRRILRARGIEVVGVASNGKEAVDVVLAQRPDFVLMDIQMPIMNGMEAARRIMEQYPVCIVMLTAFSEEEYLQEAEEIGVCGYVLKPVTTETLLPRLAEALQKFQTHH